MSQQQVQRLQTLLETVQRNRQRPGEPIGAGGNVAAGNIVQKKSPANTTAAAAPPAESRARASTPEPATGQVAAPPAKPAAQAPRSPAREAAPPQPPQPPMAAQPKSAPRIPAPQPVVQEPIVPRVIEPDAQRPATRPIAQLVSKHAPAVDATFGAMLKRSLSLRPH